MLRSLRRLKTVQFDIVRLQQLYAERKKFKNKVSTQESIEKLKDIENKIDDILFVPEIISIFSDRDSQYRTIGKEGFWVNNRHYVRLMCSSGQARRNSSLWIEDCWEKPLKEILNNGRKDIELTPAKFNAYFSLAASSSHIVSTPYFTCVPDYEVTNKEWVEYINDDDTIETCEKEITFNRFDGQGLISPQMAEIWSSDLGLDYIPTTFIIRSNFIKGSVVVFDFHAFSDIYGEHYTTDVWGNKYNVRDADLILTASQFKLYNAWDSLQDYIYNCTKNEISWSVSRWSPKQEKSYTTLNYQFLQVLDLSQEQIESLCTKTINYFRGILKNEYSQTLLYLLGHMLESGDEDTLYERSQDVVAKALILNSKLIGDPYIQNHIYKSLNKKIRESYIGGLLCDGFYTTVISDPFALCQHIFSMPVTGLLARGEHYNFVWYEKGARQIAAMRAPLTWKTEVNILNLKNTPEMQEWYKYLSSGIIFNINGADVLLDADGDFDGDMLALTNQKEIIDGAQTGLPIHYGTDKFPKQKIVEEDLYNVDLKGFGSRVGFLTNLSTTCYALLPKFDPDSEEYKEIINRLKLCRKFQGSIIDAAKKGFDTKPIPPHWTQWRKKTLSMSEKEISDIDFNNSILIDKRPLFFRHLYPQYNSAYKLHIERYHNHCRNHYGRSLEEVIENPLNDKEKETVKKYYKYAPLLDTDCIVNRICRFMEQNMKEIRLNMNNKASQENIHILKNSSLGIDKDKLKKLYDVYRKFKSNRRIFRQLKNSSGDEVFHTIEQFNKQIFREALNISSDETELASLAVNICYELHESDTKSFLWNVFGNGVLENIKRNSPMISYLPCQDDDGELEFLGRKFSIKEINLSSFFNTEEENEYYI